MLQKLQIFFKKYYFYIFILLIGYSIFLRFYNLGVQSFWIDEGFSSYSALGGIKKEYFFHLLSQLFSFKIFGISDFSARFPSVIFSILNIFVFYFLAKLFFENKKKAIISTLIFSFLTWEIIWARQARFYTLLQLLFTIDLYFLYSIFTKFNLLNINLLLIFLYIGVHFHPFLWASVLGFGIILFYKIFFEKDEFKFPFKKYFPTVLILIIILVLEYYFSRKTGTTTSIPGTSSLSLDITFGYLKGYIGHLSRWIGFLFLVSLISPILLFLKKDYKKVFLFLFLYFFVFFVIAFKGFLYHTRYVFILYPIIILLGIYTIFYFYELFLNKLKNEQLSKQYVVLVFLAIVLTGKFTFFPKTFYEIDYTSPQPNFKEAYLQIPKNSFVVSGFPMLCEWYFGKKGNCKYSLAMDYVGDKKRYKKILARGIDNYTKIPYLGDLGNLDNGKKYYFVIDNLTKNGIIKQKILEEILKNGKIVYNSGEDYNNIIVIEYKK